MSRGKRYSEGQLNIKKVMIVILIYVLLSAGIVVLVNRDKTDNKSLPKPQFQFQIPILRFFQIINGV